MATSSHRPDQGGNPESVARVTTRGVAWLMMQSVGGRLIGFASQLVLAWLLTPADFGIIGLAYTVTALIGTLVNFGLDDVLLQRQRTMRLWSVTALWISFSLGLVGMIVLLVAAPIAARLYHAPHLIGLIATLALALPIGALTTVPYVALRAALDFRFLAAWGTLDLFATQALTVLLAWAGFGAYSFAIPAPVMAAVRVAVYWLKSPPRVRSRIRLRQVRYLVGNGAVVFGTRVITELVGQGDYITLGVMASAPVVGAYFFAFRLAAQPVRMLAGNFQNVLFPALAQMRTEPTRQATAALNAARILAYIVMPLCLLQAAVADPLLRLLFASKWLNAIPLVQILSIGLPFDAISWIAGALLHARGEFTRSFVYSVVSAPIFFAFVALGAWRAEAAGVAVAVALFYMTVPAIYSWRVFLRSGIGARRLLPVYARPTLLAVGAIGGGYLVSLAGLWHGILLLRLAVIGSLGPAAYVAALRLLDPATFTEIVDRLGLRRLWQRALGGRASKLLIPR